MALPPRDRATQLLNAAGGAVSDADGTELLRLVYDELRAAAGHLLTGERAGHTLQPTALVHEAWVRLVDQDQLAQGMTEDARRRFVRLAVRAMRNILVDHARRRAAAKRQGGGQRVALSDDLAVFRCDAATVVDLEDAFAELEQVDPRLAQVAELRIFGGMTVPETAAALQVGETTVKQSWNLARALLARRLAESSEGA